MVRQRSRPRTPHIAEVTSCSVANATPETHWDRTRLHAKATTGEAGAPSTRQGYAEWEQRHYTMSTAQRSVRGGRDRGVAVNMLGECAAAPTVARWRATMQRTPWLVLLRETRTRVPYLSTGTIGVCSTRTPGGGSAALIFSYFPVAHCVRAMVISVSPDNPPLRPRRKSAVARKGEP